MSAAMREISVILTALIGLALVAVLVSRQAQTPKVVSSFGEFFTGSIRAATAPVTGGGYSTGFGYSTF